MIILNKKAILFLSKDLNLPYRGVEQDWDIELADMNRIDEFINYYENSVLDETIKIALMALVLASLEDCYYENGIQLDKWQKIRKLLLFEINIFQPLLKYWALEKEKDNNNLFLISPSIRELLKSET